MDEDLEASGPPSLVEQASGRLRAADLMPPVNSITTFDEVSVVVSGRDGITASESVRVTEALGSIPHQVVMDPRFPAIRLGSGGSPEGALGYSAFQAALHAQNFCTGYEFESRTPDAGGPVTFKCRCGRFSGEYADMVTANTVLDEHLEKQEHALRTFGQNWRAEHAEASA